MSSTSGAPPPWSGGLEFPQARWTSFDRYGRYGAIVEVLRASLGDGPWRVLDVGDSAGHLHLFDPLLEVVGLDVELADKPQPDTRRIQGDGTCLPFPDDSFDAVVSSDVLEHVPPGGRAPFLAELARVARDLVVVAAPFDTPGVAGCEDVARRYAYFSAEQPQPQLEEHMAHGLPRLPDAIAALEATGSTVAVAGNGNLWDWLLMMVLRFQVEARPDLRALSEGYDVWYNHTLAARSQVAPFYRHLVVARSGALPDLGAAATVEPTSETYPPAELAAVLGALIAANSTEVVRYDMRAQTRIQDARFDELADRSDHLAAHLAHLDERLEALITLEVSMAEQIRSVMRRITRLGRPFRRNSPQ